MSQNHSMTVLVDDESGVGVESVMREITNSGGSVRDCLEGMGILKVEADDALALVIRGMQGVVVLENPGERN